MLKNSSRFKVNSPNVVSETIDGETVIVNLSEGTYYSLDRVGADVWNLIERDFSAGNIVATISQRFTGESTVIEDSVKTLLAQLRAEKLIVSVEEVSEEDDSTAVSIEAPESVEEFVPPALHKYSDMQELLILDPIHEVDEMEGWPAKREETVV